MVQGGGILVDEGNSASVSISDCTIHSQRPDTSLVGWISLSRGAVLQLIANDLPVSM